MTQNYHSQLIRLPLGSMEFSRQGSGPAVIICHGTSSNCLSSVFTADLVAAGFSVISPSRPGYGRTDLQTGQTAGQAAQAMVQLLDQLGISSCTVIGISGGGPTACALAADHPQRVTRLILAAALTQPETRTSEPSYKDQMAFYGPMHAVTWGMLGLLSRVSPKSMAKQTMAIFSTHDPQAALNQLTPQDVAEICHFYQGQSARLGALSDSRHTVGAELLNRISQPTLVIHSREDRSVPFSHAEWTMKQIPQAKLCEAGCTGHFFWVGPDYPRIYRQLIPFLNN